VTIAWKRTFSGSRLGVRASLERALCKLPSWYLCLRPLRDSQSGVIQASHAETLANRDGEEGLVSRVDLPGHSLELELAACFQLDNAIVQKIFFALGVHG
jgi:hypothetical protein